MEVYTLSKIVKRGYVPTDEKEFSSPELDKILKASEDLYYLINRGYDIKSASTFTANHFMLSQRQRMAIVRAVSKKEHISNRKNKEIKNITEGLEINIDGFNTIITLEVALSDSLILKCMDGTLRDLAGLRGTYRIVDKTEIAIKHIAKELSAIKVKKANFYMDAPVSNSGRLGQKIIEYTQDYDFEVEIFNENNVDRVLWEKENVITSDAIILDHCKSWINLCRRIVDKNLGGYPYINFCSIK